MFIHEALQISYRQGVDVTREGWNGNHYIYVKDHPVGTVQIFEEYKRTRIPIEYDPSYQDLIADDWKVLLEI